MARLVAKWMELYLVENFRISSFMEFSIPSKIGRNLIPFMLGFIGTNIHYT